MEEEENICDFFLLNVEEIEEQNTEEEQNSVVKTGYEWKYHQFSPILVRTMEQLGLTFKLWPAAVSLCSYLESLVVQKNEDWKKYCPLTLKYQKENGIGEEFTFKGKTVLELGAGPGLCGVFSSMLGATTYLTDLECALENLKKTVEVNQLSEETTKVRKLHWGESIPEWINDVYFDYILATDCIYSQELFEPLLQALINVSQRPSGRPVLIFIANVKRRKIQSRFWKRANQYFTFHAIHNELIDSEEEGGKKPLTIYLAEYLDK